MMNQNASSRIGEADRYVLGQMRSAELTAFENRLMIDGDLQLEVEASMMLNHGLRDLAGTHAPTVASDAPRLLPALSYAASLMAGALLVGKLTVFESPVAIEFGASSERLVFLEPMRSTQQTADLSIPASEREPFALAAWLPQAEAGDTVETSVCAIAPSEANCTRGQVQLDEQENAVITVYPARLPPGVYQIKLVGDNGAQQEYLIERRE